MTSDAPTLPLEGKKALVIGADQPAGGAIARAYAEAGADVALCALTADEAVMRARAVRREIERLGRRAPEYIMDVTLGRNVQVTTRQIVKELGGIDIAAVAPDLFLAQTIAKTTDTDLARLMQVNFSAHFFAVRALADEFRRQSTTGRIVLVTNVLGARGVAHAVAYGAAHGAVHQLVRAAATELAPDGIAVNGIALGWMEWMGDRVEAESEAAERLARFAAGRGMGEARDVGPLAVHLSTEAATRYITGQIFSVDGGLLSQL